MQQTSKQVYAELAIAATLIILGLSARLFPHPANFAPIGAIALFGGLYLPKKWALIVPLLAVYISDLFIGMYHPVMMLGVYSSFALMTYLATLAREQKNISTLVTLTLIGSIVFFIVTNAVVWGFGTMYPKTMTGLMTSYEMALPFFRNTLLSDFMYMGIFVGIMESVKKYYTSAISAKNIA